MLINPNNKEEKVFTISEYLNLLNDGLQEFSVKITGEVGKVNVDFKGHAYFSLRDEKDQSVISCAIWAGRYKMYGIKLEEGMKVIAYGTPSIYKPNGRISFIAETIEHAGEGELKKKYEELKTKLDKEGIFAESEKRSIPNYVQKIGVITSKQGAVWSDFLSNIGKHGFRIKIIDSRVEGAEAVLDLLSAIKMFKKQDIEVLVIMRGGGSFESLQAFNNELLVREVAGFPVPVIAAIGHDKDVPLISLAADREVSTPSIATVVLNESWDRAALLIEKHERKIISEYGRNLEDIRNIIDVSVEVVKEYSDSVMHVYETIRQGLIVSMQNFKNGLININNDITVSRQNIFSGFRNLALIIGQQLNNSEAIVLANNPERHLKLGYSIAKIHNRIVKNVGDISMGDVITLLVADGEIVSEVKNKINKK